LPSRGTACVSPPGYCGCAAEGSPRPPLAHPWLCGKKNPVKGLLTWRAARSPESRSCREAGSGSTHCRVGQREQQVSPLGSGIGHGNRRICIQSALHGQVPLLRIAISLIRNAPDNALAQSRIKTCCVRPLADGCRWAGDCPPWRAEVAWRRLVMLVNAALMGLAPGESRSFQRENDIP